MRRLSVIVAIAALVASAVAVVAALGASSPPKPATVKTRGTTLGTIRVDGRARTLDLFEKDRHGKSTCSGACATNWPPLLTKGKAKGKAKAATGVKASLLGRPSARTARRR